MRQEFAGYFKEEQSLDTVMFCLLRLMSSNPSSNLFNFPGHLNPKGIVHSVLEAR